MRKTNYFDKSSPAGNLEMRYSNGPDSGCLVTVDEEVVAADDGEHQRDNINYLCPIKGTSEDLSRSYPLMAVKLGKEVATS